jgi:hypothetical protein
MACQGGREKWQEKCLIPYFEGVFLVPQTGAQEALSEQQARQSGNRQEK